jgi:hypothetical protein
MMCEGLSEPSRISPSGITTATIFSDASFRRAMQSTTSALSHLPSAFLLRIIFRFVYASRYRGAMKALPLLGFGLMNLLERLMRTRLRSIALFRELFFWRLRRELRR